MRSVLAAPVPKPGGTRLRCVPTERPRAPAGATHCLPPALEALPPFRHRLYTLYFAPYTLYLVPDQVSAGFSSLEFGDEAVQVVFYRESGQPLYAAPPIKRRPPASGRAEREAMVW